jgi:hypothetical protein
MSQQWDGGIVIPISLPYIYSLSTALQPLSTIQGERSLKDSFYTLLTAETMLNTFLTQSVYSTHLKATRAPAMKLLGAIRRLTIEPDKDRLLDIYDVYSLHSAFNEFDTVMTAELEVGNAFWVTQKRGYDSHELINTAENLFPPELIERVPETIYDLRQLGKCIAFELGTAAGFHAMRATELVLRQYWDSVTNGKPRPETNNIGDYLRELDRLQAGDQKTRATLRQIKDLHRNELIHPEVVLSLDDAIALLGIAQSAIIAMLREIPGPQQSLPSLTP